MKKDAKRKGADPKAARNSRMQIMQAEHKAFRAALVDFRDHGTRYDLNPTESISFSHADGAGFDSYIKGRNDGAKFYQEYLARADRSIRARAAVALGEKTVTQAAWENLLVGGVK